jgi:hypothetical protein
MGNQQVWQQDGAGRRRSALGFLLRLGLSVFVLAVIALSSPAPGLAASPVQDRQAVIVRPAQDAVMQGVVPVVGTATDPAFQRYELYYTPWPVAGNNAWIFVGPHGHYQQLPLGLLGTWDSRAVPDGTYGLRLRVVRKDGNYIDSEPRRVVVANVNARDNSAAGAGKVKTPAKPTSKPSPTVTSAAGAVLRLEVGSASDGATRVPLAASLVSAAGKPIPGARIIFLVNGARDGEDQTDANGQVTWRIRRDLPAGNYPVEAFWDGAPAVRASIHLTTGLAQIVMQMSPATPQVGDRLSITAHMTGGAGQPVPSATIELLINGQHQGTARTDQQGYALWRLGNSLPAGEYRAEAVFSGQLPVLPARVTQSFTVAPAQLEIRTAPALPGTSFVFDGRPFVTGQDGIAHISVDRTGVYSLTVGSQGMLAPGVRSAFAGWDDDKDTPDRNVQIPAKAPLEAGFDMFYLITPKFTQAQHEAVDPQRVSSLTLSSSIGQKVSMDRIKPTWIQGSHVVAGPEHLLEARPVTYTVESVLVDGANVVNQAQQRFLPGAKQDLSIDLFLYSAHFSASDALLGFPISSTLVMTYPDGQTRRFALGPGGQVTVNSLARGAYRVQLDSRGLGSARPLALSRDQNVPIMLVSYLDLAIVLGSLGVLALGLLLFGRRLHRLKPPGRRAGSPSAQAPSQAQDRQSVSLWED